MPKRRSKSGVLGVAVLRRRQKRNEGRWWDVARPRQTMGRRGGIITCFCSSGVSIRAESRMMKKQLAVMQMLHVSRFVYGPSDATRRHRYAFVVDYHTN